MGNAVYPKYKGWKANGTSPAVGYYLYTYNAGGTTIPKATYSDGNLTTPNANPIVLDANGEANIFLGAGNYRFDLKTPAGALVNTFDPVSGNAGSDSTGLVFLNTIADLRAFTPTVYTTVIVLGYYAANDKGGGVYWYDVLSSAAEDGGAVIIPTSAPSVGRWKLVEKSILSVRQFGWTGTGGAADTAAIAAMLAYTNALTYPGYTNAQGRMTFDHSTTYPGGVVINTKSGSSTPGKLVFTNSGVYTGFIYYDNVDLKLGADSGDVIIKCAGVTIVDIASFGVTINYPVYPVGGIIISGSEAGAPSTQGLMIKGTVGGFQIRAVAASSYDFTLWSAVGADMLHNPTGTSDLEMFSGNFTLSRSVSGGANKITVGNGSNTANADAILGALAGGSSSRGAYSKYDSSVASTAWCSGLYVSTADYIIAGASQLDNTNVGVRINRTYLSTKFGGALIYKQSALSGNTTLDPSYSNVIGDATGASFTLTLPAASGTTGLRYTIWKKDITANTITIDGNASETINGALTVVLGGNVGNSRLVIECDGTGWRIIELYEEGTYTGTLTGCTTSPTGTITYTLTGKIVSLNIPVIQATSNTTDMTVTGMPAHIRPSISKSLPTGPLKDNGNPTTTQTTSILILTNGTLSFSLNGSGAGFTNANNKGMSTNLGITYTLQ